mgnify:FL=1
MNNDQNGSFEFPISDQYRDSKKITTGSVIEEIGVENPLIGSPDNYRDSKADQEIVSLKQKIELLESQLSEVNKSLRDIKANEKNKMEPSGSRKSSLEPTAQVKDEYLEAIKNSGLSIKDFESSLLALKVFVYFSKKDRY